MADISGIKINRQAARDIMKMPAVRADLVARGQRIARNAECMSESGTWTLSLCAMEKLTVCQLVVPWRWTVKVMQKQ